MKVVIKSPRPLHPWRSPVHRWTSLGPFSTCTPNLRGEKKRQMHDFGDDYNNTEGVAWNTSEGAGCRDDLNEDRCIYRGE